MKVYLLVSCFLLVACFGNEPSVFNAGDLSSQNPYGLTSSEKHILKNKKKITRLSAKISDLEEKLNTISNLFLTTTDKMQKDIFAINKKMQSIESRVISELGIVTQNIEAKVSANAGNVEKLKQILLELSNLTKSINKSYIDQSVLKDYVKKADLKNKKIKKQKNKISKPSNKFAKDTGHSLVKKGEALLAKKQYTKALPIFQELLKRNYKASRSNYYIGEIYFYKKQYSKALTHYEASVKIFSKSSFLPNLLLNSGKASTYIGSKKKAKRFFQSIVDNFPKSKEAKKAKKLLLKLKK